MEGTDKMVDSYSTVPDVEDDEETTYRVATPMGTMEFTVSEAKQLGAGFLTKEQLSELYPETMEKLNDD